MAERGVPHYHNQPGAAAVGVGAKEFMCIGALPPFDHPHSFMDMGADDEIVCPYCATLFRYRADLAPDGCDPAACAYDRTRGEEDYDVTRAA